MVGHVDCEFNDNSWYPTNFKPHYPVASTMMRRAAGTWLARCRACGETVGYSGERPTHSQAVWWTKGLLIHEEEELCVLNTH